MIALALYASSLIPFQFVPGQKKGVRYLQDALGHLYRRNYMRPLIGKEGFRRVRKILVKKRFNSN